MTAPRQRWRMPLDQLAYLCKVDVYTLNTWASDGALGRKYIDQRSGGGSRWRHITREMAQRAVLMSRLTRAGVGAAAAARVAETHNVGEVTDLIVKIGTDVEVRVSREDLP